MSIDIKFTINDILLNQESLQKKNTYTCPICYEFIYKKPIYQCKSGHHACEQCWESSLQTRKVCMTCRTEVSSFTELSRCLILEQLFGQQECCCLYSYTDEIFDMKGEGENFEKKLIKDKENGCKENMVVDDVDNHLGKCRYKFCKCPNKGCGLILRLNSLEQHEDQCEFKLITCKYCKEDTLKNRIDQHNEQCPKVTVECSQGCLMAIERDEMKSHIEEDCENTIIPCKYYEHGCFVRMVRSELQNHLENVNHQKFMGELIDKLTSKVRKYEMALNLVRENLDDQYIKKKQFRAFSDFYKNKWIISNYSNVARTTVGCFDSPSFLIITHKFYVFLFPNDADENGQNYLSIYLKSNTLGTVTVDYSLTLINVLDKQKSISIKKDKRVLKGNENKGWGGNYLRSYLVNKENGWLNDDDKLTIKIYVKLLNDDIQPLENFKNKKN
ncbi:hypothetical protein ACTFIV_007998 [Dictyostelium citrinum]